MQKCSFNRIGCTQSFKTKSNRLQHEAGCPFNPNRVELKCEICQRGKFWLLNKLQEHKLNGTNFKPNRAHWLVGFPILMAFRGIGGVITLGTWGGGYWFLLSAVNLRFRRELVDVFVWASSCHDLIIIHEHP